MSVLGVRACVRFGSKCETGQPELSSETGEWVTGEAVGNPVMTVVFMNLQKQQREERKRWKNVRRK